MSTIKRTFDTMTAEELISELQAREVRIQSLERECKKWKASAKAITAKTPAPAAAVSPEKAKESARNLKNLITRGIESQINGSPPSSTAAAPDSRGPASAMKPPLVPFSPSLPHKRLKERNLRVKISRTWLDHVSRKVFAMDT